MGYEQKKWNWGESNPRPAMRQQALSTCLGWDWFSRIGRLYPSQRDSLTNFVMSPCVDGSGSYLSGSTTPDEHRLR